MEKSNLFEPIKIYSWPGVSGLPSCSHFCLKVIYALYYLGIPFEIKYIQAELRPKFPSWLKHNRLPAIEIGDMKIEDSTQILKALDGLLKVPKLYPEKDTERLETLLLEDWSDERFQWFYHYFSLKSLHARKEFDVKVLKSTLIDRYITVKLFRLRRKLILYALGIGDCSEEENYQLFTESLSLLEKKLSINNFLTYSQPTASDFACFPILQLLLATQLPKVSSSFHNFPKIEKWFQSMSEVCNLK